MHPLKTFLLAIVLALTSLPMPADAQFIRISEVIDSLPHLKVTRYSAAAKVSDCSATSTWRVSNNISYTVLPIAARPRGREIFLQTKEVGVSWVIASLKCSSTAPTLVDSFPVASVLGLVTTRGDPAVIVTKLETTVGDGRILAEGARIVVGNPSMPECRATATMCIETGKTVQLCARAYNKWGSEMLNSCNVPTELQNNGWFAYMNAWGAMMKGGRFLRLYPARVGPRRDCWATITGFCAAA